MPDKTGAKSIAEMCADGKWDFTGWRAVGLPRDIAGDPQPGDEVSGGRGGNIRVVARSGNQVTVRRGAQPKRVLRVAEWAAECGREGYRYENRG